MLIRLGNCLIYPHKIQQDHCSNTCTLSILRITTEEEEIRDLFLQVGEFQ